MERRFSLIARLKICATDFHNSALNLFSLRVFVYIFAITLCCANIKLYSQNATQRERIQLCIWADLEACPELSAIEKEAHPNDSVFSHSIRGVRELSSYLVTGMVYGWSFVYTPSDKARNVAEYMEVSETRQLGDDRKKIDYKSPRIEDNRLYIWIEFYRTPEMMRILNQWESVIHRSSSGTGSGSVFDGFDGIKAACNEALKNALRSYFRGTEKNKPKEINGKVLLRGIPRLSVISGRYVIDLDFFIETGTIIKYTQF